MATHEMAVQSVAINDFDGTLQAEELVNRVLLFGRYLKALGFQVTPGRILAQEFRVGGLIEVNGAVAKSGKEVKVGDEITINRRNRKLTVRVTFVPDSKQVSKHAAGDLYAVIADVSVEST